MISTNNNASDSPRRGVIYGISVVGGALVGLLAGFLFIRSAEDEIARSGKAEPVKPFELLLLAGTLLGLMRQISELSQKSRK